MQRAAQHAFGQLARKAVSHLLELTLGGLELFFYFAAHLLERLPRFGLRCLHHLLRFSLRLAALAFAPARSVAPDFGQPPVALLFSGARLLDQLLGAIIQVLEPALALGEQVQERAKK